MIKLTEQDVISIMDGFECPPDPGQSRAYCLELLRRFENRFGHKEKMRAQLLGGTFPDKIWRELQRAHSVQIHGTGIADD